MAKPRKRTGAAKRVTTGAAKAAAPKGAKRPARKVSKKATKRAAKKVSKKATKRAATAPSKKASPSARALADKRHRAKTPAAKKTVPGGTAPIVDDVTQARRHLREVRGIIERVSDRDAELIVGDGNLEALLSAVVPGPGRGQKSPYEHLLAHKHRASLLARIRHGINDRSAFPVEDGSVFISPTRVQWFYDGLTFVEGRGPYRGVVGLYRDGVVRYGLSVMDVEKDEYLGPLASDFVSVEEAKKSFRGAAGKSEAGLARLLEIDAQQTSGTPAGTEDGASPWAGLLMDHPWMFGGQFTAITRLTGPGGSQDPDLPEFVAKRAADGAHDILLIEDPATPIVGKTGKVLTSFRDIWSKAERLRTFVQRQSTYLQRELRLKIREPRFIIVAGRGLSEADRAAVQREFEVHHAAVRLVTYDGLRTLAERTLSFFEDRV